MNKQVQELLDAGGFLIGSRALGVANDESDYDIAISKSNLPNRLKELKGVNIRDYLHLFPINNMGNSSMLRQYGVDVLVYDNERTLNAVREALEVVKQCPIELLKDKNFRINAFEKALINTGLFE